MDFPYKSENTLQSSGDIARQYAQVLGLMPQSFALAVRSLIIDFREGHLQASPRSTFQVRRLLKAPTILSSIYYATKSFLPKSLTVERPITPMAMARLYDPLSLASLLALSYLYRRSRRIADPEEWKFISEPLQRNLEMGALIGLREKEIGMGYGILSGSMLFIAFATMLSHDKKGFTEYRRYLKKHSKDIDPEYESQRWGCTSAQIAANIMLSMGFGINLSAGLAATFLVDLKKAKPKDEHVRRFLGARSWIVALYRDLELPSFVQGTEEDYRELLDVLGDLIEKGSLYGWLERNKNEIGNGKTPELIMIEGEGQMASSGIDSKKGEILYSELPADIRSSISEQDFYLYKYNTIEEIRVILGIVESYSDNSTVQ